MRKLISLSLAIVLALSLGAVTAHGKNRPRAGKPTTFVRVKVMPISAARLVARSSVTVRVRVRRPRRLRVRVTLRTGRRPARLIARRTLRLRRSRKVRLRVRLSPALRRSLLSCSSPPVLVVRAAKRRSSTRLRCMAAAAVVTERVGLASHLVWGSEPEARAQLSTLAAGRVRWVREDFPWRVIQPARGAFDWRQTDGLMAAAAAAGVNVLPVLGYSARWASSDPSGRGDVHYPPSNPADYAHYARKVVERYGPGGQFWAGRRDLVPRPVTAVELWNEPFGHWSWKPEPDPRRYAQLARAAATAVRQATPSVQILVTGDLLQNRRSGPVRPWLDEMLAADPGLPGLVNAFSIHPYPAPRTAGPLGAGDPRYGFRRVALAREAAVKRGVQLPFWITEIGWSTALGNLDSVPEITQAGHLRAALDIALGDWRSFVSRVFVYSWDRSTGVTGDREGNYGLRRANGSPKPAWDVVSRAAAGSP